MYPGGLYLFKIKFNIIGGEKANCNGKKFRKRVKGSQQQFGNSDYNFSQQYEMITKVLNTLSLVVIKGEIKGKRKKNNNTYFYLQ